MIPENKRVMSEKYVGLVERLNINITIQTHGNGEKAEIQPPLKTRM